MRRHDRNDLFTDSARQQNVIVLVRLIKRGKDNRAFAALIELLDFADYVFCNQSFLLPIVILESATRLLCPTGSTSRLLYE